MPLRKDLRKVFKSLGGIGTKLLDWVHDVPELSLNLFDSQFLYNMKSEYSLPCYPSLFRDYCEYLDRNKNREDIKNMFYDPRPKLAYETLGTKGCKELNFSLEKCYEKICSNL